MKNHTLPDRRPRIPDPREALRRAWVINRPLTFVGLLMLGTLAIALAGLVVDPRVITGAPAWLKPMKFAISISIYCFTLLWLLTFIRGRPRLVKLVSWVTAVGVEMALIVSAAALGTTSHFNMSTPFHATVSGAMAFFIVLDWLMNLLAIVLLLNQRLPNPAFAWSLRLGLLVASVGMAVAFFMTSGPTPRNSRPTKGAKGCRSSARTASGWRTAGRGCPSPAGAPSVATCA